MQKPDRAHHDWGLTDGGQRDLADRHAGDRPAQRPVRRRHPGGAGARLAGGAGAEIPIGRRPAPPRRADLDPHGARLAGGVRHVGGRRVEAAGQPRPAQAWGLWGWHDGWAQKMGFRPLLCEVLSQHLSTFLDQTRPWRSAKTENAPRLYRSSAWRAAASRSARVTSRSRRSWSSPASPAGVRPIFRSRRCRSCSRASACLVGPTSEPEPVR